MAKLTTVLLATLLSTASAPTANIGRQCSLHMSEQPESAFVADVPAVEDDDDTFDAVEKMGRGAAKVRDWNTISFAEEKLYRKLCGV